MKFLATVAAGALACSIGCTAHNPNYMGGGGGGTGGDLAGVTLDLAGAILDLSGPMGSCTPDQRKCAGAAASDRCEAGMFVVDRACPPGSSCANDYCAPPTAMFGTQIGARCDANGGAHQLQCMASPMANLTCQPFVDPGTKNVRWFCDTAVAPGKTRSPCTRNNECRSGVCAVSAGVCFEACQRDQDCQLGGGTATCQSLQITIEGVTITGKGCA
jgi:hypothetical protein